MNDAFAVEVRIDSYDVAAPARKRALLYAS